MNKFRVETHDNSREYFSSIVLEENALYITSSIALSNMLVEENNYFNKNKLYVQNYEKFIGSLFPFKVDLLFQDALKKSLRAEACTLIKELNSEEASELQDGLEHVEELYEAMEVIMIFGLGEFKKNEVLTISERVFIKLYNRLLSEKNWKIVYEDYSNLGSFLNIEEKIKGFKGKRIGKIYFYNFTNITISMYIVFQMLRFAGYEIEFKAPYFNGLKDTNNWFNKLYGEDFIVSFNLDKSYEAKAKSCKYIASLEGLQVPEIDDCNIELRAYSSIMEFKGEASKATKVISFNKDEIDEMEGLIYGREKTLYITDLSLNAHREYYLKKNKENRFIKLDFVEKISKGNELVLGGIRLEKLSKTIVEDYLKFTIVNSLLHFDGIIKFSFIRDLRDDESESLLFKQLRSLYGVNDKVNEDFKEVSPKGQLPSYNYLQGIDLTEKQIEIVNDEQKQMLIHGLAGTGKSITLLYKFVNTLVQEQEPKRILLVTYNSNLITDIKKRLEDCAEFNLNKSKHEVDIVTFHEAATEILLGNNIIERGLEYTNADTIKRNRDMAFRRLTSILHKYREEKNIEYKNLLEEERLFKSHGEAFIVEEIFWMKANGLVTEEKYLKTERKGRDHNIVVTAAQKNTIYKIFKEYEEMNKDKFANHLDLEDYALRIIENIQVIKSSNKYDYIFVDEYPDLDPMQIKALCLLTNKSIVMAGDQRQRIYNKSPLSYGEIGLNLLEKNGNKNLSKTFRSTVEIIKLANSLKIKDADYREDEAAYNSHGDKPIIYVGKHVPALKFVVKEIKSILLQNPKASIAIIHREDVKDNVAYARSEQEKNLSAQLSTVFLRIGEYNKLKAYNDNNILYTDPYNVKGMEFDVVFILDFCKVYYPNIKKINKVNEVNSARSDNSLDIEAIHNLEKKLLYVAMTRAKDKLYFVANLNDRAKPSVFLDEFDKADYVAKGDYFKK